MCVLKISIVTQINRILQTNVLVTDEGKACLCDFGLSSLMLEFYDTTFCTSTIGGNARWAAPEIYHITVDNAVPSATSQSDVYSLGCIMLQVRLRI
jgi:serine/threonine protein kinase